MLACDVKIEGVRSIDEDTPPVSRFSSFIMPGTLAITGSGTDWVPAGTFRSAATFNGVDNYLVTVPHIVTAYVSGSPLLIAAVKNATLNTSSFALAGTNTGVEIDASATSISGGRNVSTWMVGPGVSEHHFDTHVWNVRGESMTYRGSGIYGDLYTVAVKKVDPSGSDSTVRLAFNWADVG
jgi:hypothetical protein